MSTNTAAAGALGALAKGAEGLVSGIESRQDAKIKQAEGEAKLQELQLEKQYNTTEEDIQTLTDENEKVQNELSQARTFAGLRAYSYDLNPRHLNRLLNQDPVLRDLYADVASIDKLDITNDSKLMQNYDITPEQLDGSGRYLKATNKDGSKTIIDMVQIYGSTGYTEAVEDKDIEQLKTIMQAKNKAGLGKDNRTSMQKNAEAVSAAKERVATGKGTAADKELIAFGDKELGGVKPGRADIAEETTVKLTEAFGGESEFFNTDFGKQENFNKAYPFVAKIEQLEGTEFSSADKTMMHDIRALIAMGAPASELSPAETGLMDNILLDAKKYITDEVTGLPATSAYLAFSNSVRHALYGSALTTAEIKSYREAYGTLKQKAGPVFAQFKTSLQQVKAKLQSVASMMNPYSAKVRLGVDVANIDYIIRAIDYRIDALNGLDPAQRSTKQKLDAAFGVKQ